MLQTIYEGESSFSTTEGRVGHQQLPNQSKMHNVNNSGDHTARCYYSSWGISAFQPSFPPPFYIPVSVFPLSLNLFLLLRSLLILSACLSHVHSLPLSRTLQLFALPLSLILCEKRTQSFSTQQRGRIRHFFLNQGIYSCYDICCFIICISQWDCYLNLC